MLGFKGLMQQLDYRTEHFKRLGHGLAQRLAQVLRKLQLRLSVWLKGRHTT